MKTFIRVLLKCIFFSPILFTVAIGNLMILQNETFPEYCQVISVVVIIFGSVYCIYKLDIWVDNQLKIIFK